MGISDKLKGGLAKYGAKDETSTENRLRPTQHSDGNMYYAPQGSAISPPVQSATGNSAYAPPPPQDNFHQPAYTDHTIPRKPTYNDHSVPQPINNAQTFDTTHQNSHHSYSQNQNHSMFNQTPVPNAPLTSDHHNPSSQFNHNHNNVPTQQFNNDTNTNTVTSLPFHQRQTNTGIHEPAHDGTFGNHHDPVPQHNSGHVPLTSSAVPSAHHDHRQDSIDRDNNLGYVAPTGSAVPQTHHNDRRDSFERENNLGHIPPTGSAVTNTHNNRKDSFDRDNNLGYVPPTGSAVAKPHDSHRRDSFDRDNNLGHVPPTGSALTNHHDSHRHDNLDRDHTLGHIAPTGSAVTHPHDTHRRDSSDGDNTLGYIPPKGTAVAEVPLKADKDGVIRPAPQQDQHQTMLTPSSNAAGHIDPHLGFQPKVMHKCHHCGIDNDISNYFRKEAVYRIS